MLGDYNGDPKFLKFISFEGRQFSQGQINAIERRNQSKPIGKQGDRKASRKLCNSYVIYQK